MKCLNCGFDTEQKFCPMCGNKMPDQSNFLTENPYDTNVAQPTPQPVVQPNTANPNIVVEPMQAFSNLQKPSTPQKKTSHKTLTIVITTLIALVVIAGIVINSVCSAMGVSFTKTLMNLGTETVEEIDDYDYDAEYYGKLLIKGDTATMNYSTLTLKDYALGDFPDEAINYYGDDYFDKNSVCLSATFEITNTSTQTFTYEPEFAFYAYPADDEDISFTTLYTGDDESFTLEASEVSEFTVYFDVSVYASEVVLQYEQFYETIEESLVVKDDYSDHCRFSLPLDDAVTDEIN